MLYKPVYSNNSKSNAHAQTSVNAKKTIGIMINGGDCAGLNAIVRAITHHAVKTYGWRVLGFRRGYWGIRARPIQTVELTPDICDHRWIVSGGSFLGSNKNVTPPLVDYKDHIEDLNSAFCEGYRDLNLDAIVMIGGDGSFKRLSEIHDHYEKIHTPDKPGINFVAIPKTIDNDVAYTDLAVGHETALEVVISAIDNIQSTAETHDRVMVVEVMGRDAGHIAIKAGVAAGVDAILIPEIPYDIDDLASHIQKIYHSGKSHAIVVVAESVKTPNGEAMKGTIGAKEQTRYRGIGFELALQLKEKIPAEIRSVALGHIQRGGGPRIKDRLLANRFGVHAVDLIAKNQSGHVIIVSNGKMSSVPLSEVASTIQTVDVKGEIVHVAKSLGIYLGNL